MERILQRLTMGAATLALASAALGIGFDDRPVDVIFPAPRADRRDLPLDDPRAYDDHMEVVEHLEGIEGFHGRLKRAFGNRYGGRWVNRKVSPSVLEVGVVRATPEDQRTLDLLTGLPERIRVVSVTYPERRMRRWQGAIFDALNRKAEGSGTASADLRQQVITVYAPNKRIAFAAIERARIDVPRKILRFVKGGVATVNNSPT